MHFIIHADDFGQSKGITDSILECFDQGALTSTSILANGHAFDYAIAAYRQRPNLRLSIHLNLAEGKPLLPVDQVSMLVGPDGHFHSSFAKLWMIYIRADLQAKATMRQQIHAELTTQIQKVKNALGPNYEIQLDSHCHFHILPFVFDEIIALKKQFDISYVRVPSEPFFICWDSVKSFQNYLSVNILKFLIANRLMRHKKKQLADVGIQCNDYFIGVLFVAGMTHNVVETALKQIRQKNAVVEILFHPGVCTHAEKNLFRKPFNYDSPWQKIEQDTIKSPAFHALLNNAKESSP